MGSWIVSLEGSPAGETLALVLVLVSAVTHAMFGVIFKGGVDPYINRGAINISYSIMALPVALFVLPMPSAQMWAVLACSFLAHVFYELLQARAYSKGAFTLVYPVARGTRARSPRRCSPTRCFPNTWNRCNGSGCWCCPGRSSRWRW